METYVEIHFSTQHGENQSPTTERSPFSREAQKASRDRHMAAINCLHTLKSMAEEHALTTALTSDTSTMRMHQVGSRVVGPRMSGGGPITTDVATLTLITVSVPVAIAFMKAAKEVVLQILKNKGSQGITYKSKGKTIVISGQKSPEEILKLLSEAEGSASTASLAQDKRPTAKQAPRRKAKPLPSDE